MALGELRRNYEELKGINENQETRVRFHETKVQNIVIGYLIWGRLFFFGIFQISLSFKCKDWWVVLALSLSCTFVYFLLFLDAVTMLSRTQYQLDLIRQELTEICQQILVAQIQDNVGVGLSMEAGESSNGFGLSFHEKMLMLDHFRTVGRKVYIYFTVCALLALTAIELYACKYLLCN